MPNSKSIIDSDGRPNGYDNKGGWGIDTSDRTKRTSDSGHIPGRYQWEETVDISQKSDGEEENARNKFSIKDLIESDLVSNKKFDVITKAVIWAVIASVLCLILYIISLVVINSFSSANNVVPYWAFVVRDVFLVLMTIGFTTILTSTLIEARSRNDLYAETILSDVLGNPVFYRSFSLENKNYMLSALEKELLFKNCDQIQQMYSSIQAKLSTELEKKYYFTECNFHVFWEIDTEKKISKKRINRTIKVRSYQDPCSIPNFSLIKWVGIDLENCFTIEGIKIDNKQLSQEQYLLESNELPESSSLNKRYCKSFISTYKNNLELFTDHDTVISVSYSTITPLSDNTYICRSRVPCKKFSVDVRLMNPDYKLNATAFGFLDSAQNSPTALGDQEIRAEFDSWVFSKDGVVISLSPAND